REKTLQVTPKGRPSRPGSPESSRTRYSTSSRPGPILDPCHFGSTREAEMSYNLDQFIADCRAALAQDPGPAGREKIRRDLERLLRDPDFIARHCSDATPAGLHVLHHHSALGFQVLARINQKAPGAPPHHHGPSWPMHS